MLGAVNILQSQLTVVVIVVVLVAVAVVLLLSTRTRIEEEAADNPFLVSMHRKCKLEAPSKIEPPAWKRVRPRRERTRDDDDFLPLPEGDRGGEFWLQLKSPFVGRDERRETWEILAEEDEDEVTRGVEGENECKEMNE